MKNFLNFRVTFKAMLLLMAFCAAPNVFSQVTIGAGTAPNPNAILDLKENADGSSTRGLLLPRVALHATDLPNPMQEHVAGMLVFNTVTAGTGENRVTPGYYFNTGEQWERLRIGVTNWFYMPSIPLDVSHAGPHTVNLHEMYADMLRYASHSSLGAPPKFKSVLAADQIYYYIVGYDDTVFDIIGITAEGELTYYVNVGNVSDATFMNIIFVER